MTRGRPDWSPTAIDVILRPEWAAIEGIDKNFHTSADPINAGGSTATFYDIPANKTLYITQVTGAIWGSAAADRDLNQIGLWIVKNVTTGVIYIGAGGHGGIATPMNKPITFPTGERLGLYVYNETNHAVGISIAAFGYEV